MGVSGALPEPTPCAVDKEGANEAFKPEKGGRDDLLWESVGEENHKEQKLGPT